MIGLSQRPLPDNLQQSQGTDINSPGGIRTRNFRQAVDADPCLRWRRHWNRRKKTEVIMFCRLYTCPLLTYISRICKCKTGIAHRKTENVYKTSAGKSQTKPEFSTFLRNSKIVLK